MKGKGQDAPILRKRTQAAAPFGNRIIKHGECKAGEFLANPRNWRIHPVPQQEAIDSVLSDIGYVQSVIVNMRTHTGWGRDRSVETLLDGHLRVQAALARGEETMVPTIWVDLTPAEERRVLTTLDPIGTLAGKDQEKLDELIQEVETEWPDSEMDLAALFSKREPKQGLTHDVHECTCCKDGCKPGCGCYREE